MGDWILSVTNLKSQVNRKRKRYIIHFVGNLLYSRRSALAEEGDTANELDAESTPRERRPAGEWVGREPGSMKPYEGKTRWREGPVWWNHEGTTRGREHQVKGWPVERWPEEGKSRGKDTLQRRRPNEGEDPMKGRPDKGPPGKGTKLRTEEGNTRQREDPTEGWTREGITRRREGSPDKGQTWQFLNTKRKGL